MTVQFSQLGISSKVIEAMNDMGWTEPTPIQVEAIPCGLKGMDMLAQAQTGTGKTGTYGTILLCNIPAKQRTSHALVLAPTRELALQVSEELDKLSKYTGHTNVPIYGGVNMGRQTQALDRGSDIIIATPGRLKDHLQTEGNFLDDIEMVVLDEADRMLDMGFAKDLEYIMARVPKKRQTMLFSATMSSDIKKLALRQLVKPKEIFVSKDEPVLDLITQYYMMVRKEDKIETLRYVLGKEQMKTIVFCHTKHRVDQVVRKLQMSFKMAGIHGNHAQNRRERTIKSFKDDQIDVLVASDIAARGLDIDNVLRVVNMDMPLESETYVHRIGRTGRAGKQGIAVSFVMPDERSILSDIKRLTGIPLSPLDPPTDQDISKVASTIKQLDRPAMAKPNSRKNDVPVKNKKMVVTEINIGNADRYGKALISKFIHDNSDVPKKSIGDIDLGEKTSRVEIERTYLKQVMTDLSKCDVDGKPFRIEIVGELPNDGAVEESASNIRDAVSEERPRQNDRPREYRPRSNSGTRRPSDGSRRPSGDRPRQRPGDSEGRSGERPREYRPRSDSGARQSGDGSRQYKPRSDSDRPSGDRPRQYRPRSDSERSDRSSGDRPRSNSGARQSGDGLRQYKPRSDSDRPSGDRPRQYRPRSDSGARQSGDGSRQYKPRSDSDRPSGDRPRQYRSKSDARGDGKKSSGSRRSLF